MSGRMNYGQDLDLAVQKYLEASTGYDALRCARKMYVLLPRALRERVREKMARALRDAVIVEPKKPERDKRDYTRQDNFRARLRLYEDEMRQYRADVLMMAIIDTLEEVDIVPKMFVWGVEGEEFAPEIEVDVEEEASEEAARGAR